jgi:hypothetical protein
VGELTKKINKKIVGERERERDERGRTPKVETLNGGKNQSINGGKQ